jgi:uncharacterized membrane protein
MTSRAPLWSWSARTVDAIAVGLMTLPLIASLALWSQLPAEMAIHWSGSTPNNFASKPVATFGLFAFGVALVAAIRILPDSMTSTPGGPTPSILFLGVVLAWVQSTVLVWNLGYQFNVTVSVIPIVILAALLVVYSYRHAPSSS